MNASPEEIGPEDVTSILRERILQLCDERHLLDQHIERALKELQSRCGHELIVEAERGHATANRRICATCSFEENEDSTTRFAALRGRPVARLPVIAFVQLRRLQPEVPPFVLDGITPEALRERPARHGGDFADQRQADSLAETLDAAAQQIEKYPWLFNKEPKDSG